MIMWPLRGAVAAAVVLAVLVARRAPQHRPVALGVALALALDCARALLPLYAAVEFGLYAAAAALSMWVAARVFGLPSWARKGNRPGSAASDERVTFRAFRARGRIQVNFRRAGELFALAAWIGLAVVADLADPRRARVWIPPLALAVSVVFQVALVWWWRQDTFAVEWTSAGPDLVYVRRAERPPRRPATVSQHCAIVLLAGDVAGLLGPAGVLPWPRSWWWVAAAQATLVAVVLVWIQAAWLASRKIDTADDRSS